MDQPAADTAVIKGILASITGFGVFAIGDALGKWLTHDYPITELIFFNGLFGLLSVMAASPFFGGLRSIFRTKQLGLHILRALIIVSQCFMVVYAFSNLPMANVYALVFAAPLIITALSAPVLGQRVGMREWIGVLSGFTGIMIMLRPGVQPLDLPTLAAIGTAVFFSIGSIMVRVMGNRGGFRDGENMFSYSAYPMLIMAPVGAICCLIWGFKMPETGVDLMLFMGAGAMSGIGMVIMAVAFSIAPAAIVAPFHYTQMLWGAAFGYFIWSDLPDSWTIAGSALIIASGIYVIRSQARRPQEAKVTASLQDQS